MIVVEKIMVVNRKRIVIVGGSFGGVNVADELRKRLGRKATLRPYRLPSLHFGW